MNDEISEAAWERAALDRVGFILHGDANADIRYYSGDSGKITRAGALAAQAELDAANEITHAEREAARAKAAELFAVPLGATLHSNDLADAVLEAVRKARQA